MDNKCKICDFPVYDEDEPVTVREKGAIGINNASVARAADIIAFPGDRFHQICRKKIVNVKDITNSSKSVVSAEHMQTDVEHNLRSSGPFSFKDHCLFCAHPAKVSDRKRSIDAFTVKTTEFTDSIKQVCQERHDQWSTQVLSRIMYAPDLFAADAVYHSMCSSNFRTGKQIPNEFSTQPMPGPMRNKGGRPSQTK